MINWEKIEDREYIDLINSDKEKEIEHQKWDLVSKLDSVEIDTFKDELDSCITLSVASREVEFHYSSASRIDVTFLKEYLEAFMRLDESESEPVIIYYSVLKNEGESPNHSIWWEKNYYTRVKKNSADDLLIIHRNFIGKIFQESKKCLICGPSLLKGYTDTIDNIFLTCVAPGLIKASSIALHAATVIYNDEAYVFYGPSGVGKSTLAEFCYDKYGHKIMSGDQVYLNLNSKGELWAWPCVSTIYKLDRNHPAWASKPYRVASLSRLVRGSSKVNYFGQGPLDLMGSFLREVVYLPEYGNQDDLLDLAIKILKTNSNSLGTFSYEKDYDFWSEFIELRSKYERSK